MAKLYLALYLAAATCFAIGVFGPSRRVGRGRRAIDLLDLGLLFWVLVLLIKTAKQAF